MLFALDPDVLYLQSTPMTEPLLFGLTLLAVSLVFDWVAAGADSEPRAAGCALIAACLTRYEAWFVMAALIALTGVALLRMGKPFLTALKAAATLAAYPALGILAFVLSQPVHHWRMVRHGRFLRDRSENDGTTACLVPPGVIWDSTSRDRSARSRVDRRPAACGRSGALVSQPCLGSRSRWRLWASWCCPTYAFYEGHPFRMRYMIAPVVGVALFCGGPGAVAPRWRKWAATAMAVLSIAALRPLNAEAPMVRKQQWDKGNSVGRRAVTACLMHDYHHELILASMGSLAHYMQELSQEGLRIRDFVHEGNLPYWQEDIEAPRGRVGWILIEEQAEGGDVLAKRARASAEFLQGFTRVCSGGGVALYRATDTP